MIEHLGIYLIIVVLSTLGFIAVVYGITYDNKMKMKELELKYKNTTDKVPSKKVTKTEKNDQILFTLNFMLERNILTVQEYNKLMVKCLPHME